MAVAKAGSSSSNSTPSLGISIRCWGSPKREKREREKSGINKITDSNRGQRKHTQESLPHEADTLVRETSISAGVWEGAVAGSAQGAASLPAEASFSLQPDQPQRAGSPAREDMEGREERTPGAPFLTIFLTERGLWHTLRDVKRGRPHTCPTCH